MTNLINKDELIQLLKNGEIEKFNKVRPFSENSMLDLSESDLNNMSIVGANLSRVDLAGSDISKSEIEDVNFNYSDLSSVNFSRATITESNFTETILEGSLFNKTCVVSSDFVDVDFNGINACGADFTGADLSLVINLLQSIYDADTIWPDNDLLPHDFEPQSDLSFIELEEEEDNYMVDQF